MSKEQIEEMAKVLCENCAGNESPCRVAKSGKMCGVVQREAEALYTAGYRKREEIICGNSVEKWKVKINRFVSDGLRQGATTTVIAEYIVDSILEEAMCELALRRDGALRTDKWISVYERLPDSRTADDERR